jgi:ribosomal protein L37AE/L43A
VGKSLTPQRSEIRRTTMKIQKCSECGLGMAEGTTIVIETEYGIDHVCGECMERVEVYGPVMVLN